MSVKDKTFYQVGHSVGHLIYTEETNVIVGEESTTEKVHFILKLIPNNDGMLESIIVDKNWDPYSSRTMYFESLDEFYSLARYLIRNGIASIAKKP